MDIDITSVQQVETNTKSSTDKWLQVQVKTDMDKTVKQFTLYQLSFGTDMNTFLNQTSEDIPGLTLVVPIT